MGFLLFVGILVLSPFLLWFYWMAWSYRRKRKNLLFFQMAVTASVFIYATWVLRIFPGSPWYHERALNEDLTGKRFSTEGILFSYDSERSFHGDGFTICVYRIDDATAAYFSDPEDGFFAVFPAKPLMRKEWKSQRWKRSPIEETETEYLEFALNYGSIDDATKGKELKQIVADVGNILKQRGAYYAYNFKSNEGSGRVSNVDFFILSPMDKKMIIINLNT